MQEVYGPPGHVHVVVALTPELTGSVVDEPTTVSLTIDRIKKAEPAVSGSAGVLLRRAVHCVRSGSRSPRSGYQRSANLSTGGQGKPRNP